MGWSSRRRHAKSIVKLLEIPLPIECDGEFSFICFALCAVPCATIPRQAHHRQLESIYHPFSVAPQDGALSKFTLESLWIFERITARHGTKK